MAAREFFWSAGVTKLWPRVGLEPSVMAARGGGSECVTGRWLPSWRRGCAVVAVGRLGPRVQFFAPVLSVLGCVGLFVKKKITIKHFY